MTIFAYILHDNMELRIYKSSALNVIACTSEFSVVYALELVLLRDDLNQMLPRLIPAVEILLVSLIHNVDLASDAYLLIRWHIALIHDFDLAGLSTN